MPTSTFIFNWFFLVSLLRSDWCVFCFFFRVSLLCLLSALSSNSQLSSEDSRRVLEDKQNLQVEFQGLQVGFQNLQVGFQNLQVEVQHLQVELAAATRELEQAQIAKEMYRDMCSSLRGDVAQVAEELRLAQRQADTFRKDTVQATRLLHFSAHKSAAMLEEITRLKSPKGAN